MAFRKYQKVEKSSVLSKDEHEAVEDTLHKLGKTSAADLDEPERKKLLKELDSRN